MDEGRRVKMYWNCLGVWRGVAGWSWVEPGWLEALAVLPCNKRPGGTD